MRLGDHPVVLEKDSLAYEIYQKHQFNERHRHRYGVNQKYLALLETHGFRVTGKDPAHGCVEIMELQEHAWYLGCQFHPEFTSKPLLVHPLFKDFIKACLDFKRKQQ